MPAPTSTPVTGQAAQPASTETYAAAYGRLAVLAEKLKSNAAPSIDTLVEDVRAARAAHAICRERLAAVRAEIDAEIAAAAETHAEPAAG